MPRQRRPPKLFTGTAEPHVPNSSVNYFRIQYFNFVDTTMNAIEKRYNEDGLKKYVKLENVLTQATVSCYLAEMRAKEVKRMDWSPKKGHSHYTSKGGI